MAVFLALGVNILLTLTGLTAAFGAYHQVVEKQYGSFLAPVLFHSAANICVFIIGYDQRVLERIIVPVNCVIFMLISFFVFYIMLEMRKKYDIFFRKMN